MRALESLSYLVRNLGSYWTMSAVDLQSLSSSCFLCKSHFLHTKFIISLTDLLILLLSTITNSFSYFQSELQQTIFALLLRNVVLAGLGECLQPNQYLSALLIGSQQLGVGYSSALREFQFILFCLEFCLSFFDLNVFDFLDFRL